MDGSGGGPPHRGPGRDGEPALRLIQGDAHQWSEQTVSRHPGQRVPDKTDRTSNTLSIARPISRLWEPAPDWAVRHGPTSGTSGAGRPCAGAS